MRMGWRQQGMDEAGDAWREDAGPEMQPRGETRFAGVRRRRDGGTRVASRETRWRRGAG